MTFFRLSTETSVYESLSLQYGIICCHNYFCVLVNKRLDEWVEEERLDLTKLQMPKKEDTKKINKGAGSRPCSPDRELVNGVGSGRPKAPVGRKRKANAMDKSGDEVKCNKNANLFCMVSSH